MYVIIMGGGRVGLALANLLIDDGHDITLIENDEALSADVAADLDALVIHGTEPVQKYSKKPILKMQITLSQQQETTKPIYFHAF